MDGGTFYQQFQIGLQFWRLLPGWMQQDIRPENYAHLGPLGVFRWRRDVEDAFYAGC